jgi:hypothetical protein
LEQGAANEEIKREDWWISSTFQTQSSKLKGAQNRTRIPVGSLLQWSLTQHKNIVYKNRAKRLCPPFFIQEFFTQEATSNAKLEVVSESEQKDTSANCLEEMKTCWSQEKENCCLIAWV